MPELNSNHSIRQLGTDNVLGGQICFWEQSIFLQGEYFDQRSLVDSRYFGAVDTATVYGKAVPIFTY